MDVGVDTGGEDATPERRKLRTALEFLRAYAGWLLDEQTGDRDDMTALRLAASRILQEFDGLIVLTPPNMGSLHMTDERFGLDHDIEMSVIIKMQEGYVDNGAVNIMVRL